MVFWTIRYRFLFCLCFRNRNQFDMQNINSILLKTCQKNVNIQPKTLGP